MKERVSSQDKETLPIGPSFCLEIQTGEIK